MEGYAHIIVGATGTGKTTFTKGLLTLLKPKFPNICIYDINAEYKEFYDKKLLGFHDFMTNTIPLKDSIIVIEEATIFLNHHNTNAALIEKLVRKRHENNVIILNFHSIRKIPLYILDLSNYVTIFKTIDNIELMKKKLNDIPSFCESLELVEKSTDKHFNTTIKLY